MPVVYLLRRFQILKVDLDIHQGSIRRNETTASTKQMMDDDDVSILQAIVSSFGATATRPLRAVKVTKFGFSSVQDSLYFVSFFGFKELFVVIIDWVLV